MHILYIFLCSKFTNCFPSHSRAKAKALPMTYRALKDLALWFHLLLLFPHWLHTSHKGFISIPQISQVHSQSGLLHLMFSLECSSRWQSWQSHFLQILTQESTSQQILFWPPHLKFHFPLLLLLITNHFLTFKAYFHPTLYYKNFKVERVTWKCLYTHIYSTINTVFVYLIPIQPLDLLLSMPFKISCTSIPLPPKYFNLYIII